MQLLNWYAMKQHTPGLSCWNVKNSADTRSEILVARGAIVYVPNGGPPDCTVQFGFDKHQVQFLLARRTSHHPIRPAAWMPELRLVVLDEWRYAENGLATRAKMR